jgi:hypothetical protein
MRKITLSVFLLLGSMYAFAQPAKITSTFEELTLSKSDTFYVNYSSPGKNVGFTSASAIFPCVYDTIYGGLWESGFAYTNKTDSITGDYTNSYSAITAIGYNNSAKYVVGNGQTNWVKVVQNGSASTADNFYITNTTYAYKSMRNGDAFAKKFGGASGTDKDFFKITIYGYYKGVKKSDSIDFYLADFRTGVPQVGYIVKTWQKVNLLPLGILDSMSFVLNSSDTGMYGINTPLFFAMDNLTIDYSEGVDIVAAPIAKVYPNPATNMLHVSINDKTIQQLMVTDMSGKMINTIKVDNAEMTINTAGLATGAYILQLQGAGNVASVRFVKQ